MLESLDVALLKNYYRLFEQTDPYSQPSLVESLSVPQKKLVVSILGGWASCMTAAASIGAG